MVRQKLHQEGYHNKLSIATKVKILRLFFQWPFL